MSSYDVSAGKRALDTKLLALGVKRTPETALAAARLSTVPFQKLDGTVGDSFNGNRQSVVVGLSNAGINHDQTVRFQVGQLKNPVLAQPVVDQLVNLGYLQRINPTS
jgi:hypothetical protein